MIYGYASFPHYLDHLAPIIDALPPGVYGGTFTPKNGKLLPLGELWLTAGHGDVKRLPGRRVVYVEHGAGQTYNAPGAHTYAGGRGFGDVVLFVCPRQEIADRWAAAYPDARTVVAGCPKLDRWHLERGRETGSPRRRPVVAFTFHHDAMVCPEANSAWPHYRRHVYRIVEDLRMLGFEVLAHQHPRARYTARRWWEGTGAEWVDDLGTIFDRATVLAADNTSALPEFASLGRPVVWLNAPWYRRDVHHGGRFWEWPEGQIQVDHPTEVVLAVAEAIADPPQVADARARMVRTIYEHTDGQAADRAAAAIMEVYRART